MGRGSGDVVAAGASRTRTTTARRCRPTTWPASVPSPWTDVWICPWPHGHIQAVGTDNAGRRQYRYHQAWREQRDHEKFDRMTELGLRLPDLRAQVAAHLRRRGLPRDRVLAAAVRLLDTASFRIGGEE